jgi:hypothetical protein
MVKFKGFILAKILLKFTLKKMLVKILKKINGVLEKIILQV